MRIHAIFFVAILFAATAHAQTKPGAPTDPPPLPGISPKMEAVLKEINSLNAYQVPNLKLKTDENYAAYLQGLQTVWPVRPPT